MADRTLRIYTPLAQSATPLFMEDVTDAAEGWSRTISRDFGFLDGEFIIPGNGIALERIFAEYLGAHFVEGPLNLPTWEGMIYEMDITIGGNTDRIGFSTMWNYGTARYIDENGESQLSSAVQNTVSQNYFGRKETVLYLDGFKQTTAENKLAAYIATHANPQPYPVGLGTSTKPDGLEVRVMGYGATASWRFLTAGDGTDADIDAWIADIVDTDCEFLQTGRISANTDQQPTTININQPVWDVLQDLAATGIDDVPARLYVDNGRRVNYHQIDFTPRYFQRDGRLYTSAGGSSDINPWSVRPGIVRRTNYPYAKRFRSALYQDARDAYIIEVEAGDHGLHLTTDEFDDGKLLNAQARWQQALQRLEQRKSQDSLAANQFRLRQQRRRERKAAGG